ncbi:MAG TPA: hypothetical protein VFW96_17645 [Thermomicrobiales bacterium]|nr:hypothetical protein [Thermomicrobiales bacterium]
MEPALPDLPPRTPPDFALDAPDDAAFAALGERIAAYLYANFPGLRGLRQHRPHFDPARDRTTDPVEHTIEVLGNLDTRGLAPADAAILRAAAVFHDVGKLRDPLNVRHAVDSAALCPPYLDDFPLTPAGRADAVRVVVSHDVLGRLAQGRLSVAEACALFGTRRLADLTARLTWADVTSIRGLGHVLPSIAAARAAVFAAFDTGVAGAGA